MHRPPKNDTERLQNLLEGLSEPTDGDDALDELMREELGRRGLTLETWAAQFEARAQAVLDRNRDAGPATPSATPAARDSGARGRSSGR